jgi:hypothetical protein
MGNPKGISYHALLTRVPTERDTFRFMVQMGLREGLGAVRMRRALTEEEQRKIAETIVRMLETHNWKISLGEPGRAPSI